ncbi:MAG: hypothetical protein WAL34_04195 [Acidobacteriaceae bacterium]
MPDRTDTAPVDGEYWKRAFQEKAAECRELRALIGTPPAEDNADPYNGQLMPAEWYQAELAKCDQQVIDIHAKTTALVTQLRDALKMHQRNAAIRNGLEGKKAWDGDFVHRESEAALAAANKHLDEVRG